MAKHLSITKKNSSHIPTFSCWMEKGSCPLTNLFFTEPPPLWSTVLALIHRIFWLGVFWGIMGKRESLETRSFPRTEGQDSGNVLSTAV